MKALATFFIRRGDDERSEYLGMEDAEDLRNFTLETDRDILDRPSRGAEKFLADARDRKAVLESEIAARAEELRQTNIVIGAFEKAHIALLDGYNPADDAAKSYEVAVAAKRKRGDKHWPQPASLKAVEVAE